MILSVIDSHKISTITIISIIPAAIMVIIFLVVIIIQCKKEGIIPQTLKWPVYQQSHSDIFDHLACRRPVLKNLFSLWLLCSLITKEIKLQHFFFVLSPFRRSDQTHQPPCFRIVTDRLNHLAILISIILIRVLTPRLNHLFIFITHAIRNIYMLVVEKLTTRNETNKVTQKRYPQRRRRPPQRLQ